MKFTNRGGQAGIIVSERMDSQRLVSKLEIPRSFTINCDWSIVAFVTDRAWCERPIIDYVWLNISAISVYKSE